MKRYLKAIAAAVVTGLTMFLTSLDGDSIAGPEWLMTAVATVIAFGTVYTVRNSKEPDVPRDLSESARSS